MKHQLSLLALCLGSFGLASAQTPTTTYSTTSTTTVTTNGTYSATPTTTADLNSTAPTTNDDTNRAGTMMTNVNNTASTDGMTTTPDNATTQPKDAKDDYKNFVFGIYAGLNTTKFKGETINTNGGDLSGRLGYQAGFFVRGGGRLYGQIGAEFFASSSNYFTPGSGQTIKQIQDKIDIQYVQIPVYLGYKLLQSDRGISAVRLQVGLEYANRINTNSGNFNLTNAEIKSGTFNGLGQLGFDIGPLLIDFTYHYGFGQSINAVNSTGFAGSQRRILSASIGFKF